MTTITILIMMSGMHWTDEAIQELLLLLRGTNAILSEIHAAIERLALATEKKGPPSSKRGGGR